VWKHRVVSLLARRAPRLLPLRHLGGYYGTRKFAAGAGSTGGEYEGVDYAAVYERYLRSWRRRRFALLELGVYRGESLRMWRAYFPRAKIVGLDIDPNAARRATGFEVFIGSQDDTKLLARVRDALQGLDVVIDDASHLYRLTVASFDALFPHLSSGGLYFIEDVAPGDEHERAEINDLLLRLADDVGRGRERSVEFVHVEPHIIIVGRA
jgi:hypothetical protein